MEYNRTTLEEMIKAHRDEAVKQIEKKRSEKMFELDKWTEGVKLFCKRLEEDKSITEIRYSCYNEPSIEYYDPEAPVFDRIWISIFKDRLYVRFTRHAEDEHNEKPLFVIHSAITTPMGFNGNFDVPTAYELIKAFSAFKSKREHDTEGAKQKAIEMIVNMSPKEEDEMLAKLNIEYDRINSKTEEAKLMGIFSKMISDSRMKKMRESAFPTSEMRPSGDPIQAWFSRHFTIEPHKRSDGTPYTRYFIVKPNLYGEGIENGSLINKYVKIGNLGDNRNYFRLNGYVMFWEEFKNFSADIYCIMKICHKIMRYWDQLLKNPLTQAILEKRIRVITPSRLYDGEEFEMVVNPMQAEILLDLVGELVQAETPEDANIKERYAEYVIGELAKEADRLDVLNASQPTARIHNYEYMSAKFMAEIRESKATAKLKTIPLIREKMEKKDAKNSV